MIIGIDSSRAFVQDKTGTENYSYHLINHMLRLPEARLHTFVLFIRPNVILPEYLAGYSNVIVKEVKWKYLWTQVGLAVETWREQVFQYSGNPVIQRRKTGKPEHGKTGILKLDVLWIPAHTLPVLRNPRIKTVVTIHGLEYQWLKEYKNLLQRWYLPLSTIYAAKYAGKLIAVSKFTAKQLVEQLHTNNNKIKVIHEGTTFSSIPVIQSTGAVMKKFGIQAKQYILFVGSIQPRKNLVALVEAFALIARQYPDLKLVIAGGVGWEAEEVLAAPTRHGIQEKVVFTGRVSNLELQSLYLGATLYVQPSITEGFGLPVLEAMAKGVPVVSSDGGALGEVVGEAGVIVPINNQVSNNNNLNKVRNFVFRLAESMERVIRDQKLQKKLISMGYKRVAELSWEKAAKETLALMMG